ncbi:hypothetical protein Pst134EA_020954 [Puccinia striiformis f. sp. tritici]|uniref:hypothetical protein n=1 Tax=Puccinia striiformis f. sp. tritici TaxID=168172 RepID=UPI002007BB11|nr:hypothetical protein Pst134EA_020954 [Puccinia striiformis f. sp. tritici]KAH9457055.1 hypothetical protein Pst134EA_020954 [Puccinia striiformis f. sp. tritici]
MSFIFRTKPIGHLASLYLLSGILLQLTLDAQSVTAGEYSLTNLAAKSPSSSDLGRFPMDKQLVNDPSPQPGLSSQSHSSQLPQGKSSLALDAETDMRMHGIPCVPSPRTTLLTRTAVTKVLRKRMYEPCQYYYPHRILDGMLSTDFSAKLARNFGMCGGPLEIDSGR